MRVVFFALMLLGINNPVIAKGDNLFAIAKEAHANKDFSTAIENWEKLLESNQNNPAVFFNLGLAYKANKSYAKAIWAFEKTLKLEPKNSEAIQLIESCYVEMDSNQSWVDPTGPLQRGLISFGSDNWSYLAIFLSLLSGTCIILAKRWNQSGRRKWLFGTASFSIISVFICVANASSSYHYEHTHHYAVVLENIELNEKGTTVQLYAGQKVKVSEWNNDGSATVQLSDKKITLEKGLAKI
jgi:tetratricopeptide (TPR) repeat protein